MSSRVDVMRSKAKSKGSQDRKLQYEILSSQRQYLQMSVADQQTRQWSRPQGIGQQDSIETEGDRKTCRRGRVANANAF
jgi:hypothetical protein